ncbi:MAG: HupE/UreJ family protein [Cyclobacteriaceae bacterium]|jgi:hypothetical protein|nr:HupE/UreJ family protein [Cyclobacteriaceae bacterium]
MGEFGLYFGLGKDHILDYANGYDHILFVIALCAIYTLRDWRRVLILVTAFTVGHSITLALATFRIINVRSDVVEFLIPLTILLTAGSNIFKRDDYFQDRKIQLNYGLALFFGLIHGMGFSNYLREILGKSANITVPLLAFNIGLEFGQIVIVLLFLATCFIFVDLFGVSRRDWRLVISSAIAGISLVLMKDAAFW